ncbi:hypothetical protein D910_12659 [Dendroctonus ponderosae]|uniref:Glucose-methanol-choline oxidoreductase C-terminal domain-containing protein n=1 Tax=Dendroctonus ponderosae TaxID=77166 RepID=U4UYK0_DENPD|nr:hypothetical protein D910_12659 [Dendroctonus ponderosae]
MRSVRSVCAVAALCISVFALEVVSDSSDFDQFVSEILSFINGTTTYVKPTNNNAFFGNGSDSDEPLDYGTYDFIIVGSGSAGGVLVNRLSEVENFTVLLVEAGSEDPVASKILGLYTYMTKSSCDWGYYTTPQAASFLGICNRTKYTFYNNTFLENLEHWYHNERPLTDTYTSQLVTFYNVAGNSSDASDMEILIPGPPNLGPSYGEAYTNSTYAQAFKVLNEYSDFALILYFLRPKSVGKVTLASADPRDFPLINPNFFSHPDDLETLYKAVEIAKNLENTTAFQRLGVQPIVLDLPDCDENYEKLSKDWWICSMKYLTIAGLHPIGTTRMGNDTQNSVVSSKLKVHGIDKLRVVDAGVIPQQISGHISTPIMMIGEKAADFIKNEYSCTS